MKFPPLRKLVSLLPLVLFILALVIVHHEIKAYKVADISTALSSVPLLTLIVAIVLTIINYLFFAGYNVLALGYTGHKLPLHRVSFAALVSYAISNNTGHAWASGGSVRYRLYSAWNVPGWVIRSRYFWHLPMRWVSRRWGSSARY